MSTENIVQNNRTTIGQANGHRREILFIAAVLFATVVIIGFITFQSKTIELEETSRITTATTSNNALAMQYAEPWLDKQTSTAVTTGQFTNALAAYYAQPWLDKQSMKAPAPNNALAMQYAQPWLDKQQMTLAPATTYGDALIMQYAQPWLGKQQMTLAPATTYGDALIMQYAQPWLEAQQSAKCNGRLEIMYACQSGYDQP